MRDAPLDQDTNEPKMGVGKALASFAAFLGIVLAFAFLVVALIKWAA